MTCPVCDHLPLVESDPLALVVGMAYLGHAIGIEAFKENMCAPHRRTYILDLMRCAHHITGRSDYREATDA